MTTAPFRSKSPTKVTEHTKTACRCSPAKTPLQNWEEVTVSLNFIGAEKVKQNEKTKEFVSVERVRTSEKITNDAEIILMQITQSEW